MNNHRICFERSSDPNSLLVLMDNCDGNKPIHIGYAFRGYTQNGIVQEDRITLNPNDRFIDLTLDDLKKIQTRIEEFKKEY